MNEEKLHSIVQDILQDEPSGHDYLHALRVLMNARKLLNDTHQQNVIIASCLVHDLLDDKLDRIYQRTPQEVVDILSSCDLSSTDIEHTLHIIQTMSYRTKTTPSTEEGQIVQDADRLDAIGAIGIARTFAYGGANHRKMYDLKTTNGEDTVSHFYQKLFQLENLMNTTQAKHLAKERTRFMKQFLSTLYYEIGHTPSK
jgi:uncharacterized protein